MSAKFKTILVPMEVEVSQQFNLLDVTELDLKKNDHSFRLRLKPSKALFHWDLGLMTSTKVKETAPHLTLRPYVFFASDRQLNRGIWSLGNFLYINSNWQEHVNSSAPPHKHPEGQRKRCLLPAKLHHEVPRLHLQSPSWTESLLSRRLYRKHLQPPRL